MNILSENFFVRIPWLTRQNDQLTVRAPWIGEGGLSTSRDPIDGGIGSSPREAEINGSAPIYSNLAFNGANTSTAGN
jgi:hypothetical protein